MKIKDNTIFPHPVLRDGSDDYVSGFFDMNFEVDENNGKIKASYELEEANLTDLIISGRASVGFFIVCRATSYTDLKIINSDLKYQSFTFEKSFINGAVRLRPVIFSNKEIQGYLPIGINDEFQGINWSFNPGVLLAFSSEKEFAAGYAKLQPTETIFVLANNKELKDGEVKVGLEGDKVEIIISPEMHKKLNEFRSSDIGRRVLLSSLYQPVIMEVLSLVSKGVDDYEGKHWFKIFSDKCTDLAININDPNLFEDSQKILRLPLLQLTSSKELIK